MEVNFYINQNCFAFYTDFEKETSKSIYSIGMYGDEYRIEKATKKVFKNKKFIGIAEYFEVF